MIWRQRSSTFWPAACAPIFAAGYSVLSGFEAIAAQIPHFNRLRLLVGNVTNRQTIEQLVDGHHHLETDTPLRVDEDDIDT